MKNKKYIMCSGLAFADTEDMRLLHDYAKHGWVFKTLKYTCFYELHKEEPKNLIYDYDVQNIKKEDKEDYLQVFENAGWHLVGKWNRDIRFFQASEGTPNVHSEKETQSEQFRPTYYISIVVLLVGIVLLGLGIYKDISILYPLGGAGIGGGGVLCIACYRRVRGKQNASNPRSYVYQLFKLCIGLVFLGFVFRFWSGDVIDYIPFIIGVWFVISSIYSFYRIKKERELHD